MADEFAKGLAILTGSGLLWMVFAGWYQTESFEGTQLIAPPPENPGLYGDLALLLTDAFFWFAILGALAFWVVIPAGRKAKASLSERLGE